MNETVYHKLNLHNVITAKPDKCLFHYYYECGGRKRAEPFEKHCKDCEFRVDESCAYKKYIVEGASGNYDGSDEELHYVQWCCAECGELIKMADSISYIYHDLTLKLHVCQNCKTAHKCLEYEDDIYTFAVPLKFTVAKERTRDWSDGDRCR